ncbi:protease inhibitor I42 family protein [Plantactinospora sp. GCM10030261]|uniref:protease inhibitor I42 family protein n=1 Tax=Plantactinospora sp. GCM10030261 TaxID=3273420 RepID=UPI00360B0FFE
MARLELDRDAADRTFPATRGDEVVLALPETPTSGYRWSLDAYDPQVLSLAGDDFQPAAGGAMGGGGVRTFRFVARGAGATRIRLARRRPWEATGGAERFETTIDVGPR